MEMNLPEAVNKEKLPRQMFMEQGGCLQGAWISIKKAAHGPVRKRMTKSIEEGYFYSLARRSIWRCSLSEWEWTPYEEKRL